MADALFDLVGESKEGGDENDGEGRKAVNPVSNSVCDDSRAATQDKSIATKASEPIVMRGGGLGHLDLDLSNPLFLNQVGSLLSYKELCCNDAEFLESSVQSDNGIDEEVCVTALKEISHLSWKRKMKRLR